MDEKEKSSSHKPEWFEIADKDQPQEVAAKKKFIARPIIALFVSGAIIGGGAVLANAENNTPAEAETPSTSAPADNSTNLQVDPNTLAPSITKPSTQNGIQNPVTSGGVKNPSEGNGIHEFGDDGDGDHQFGDRPHEDGDHHDGFPDGDRHRRPFPGSTDAPNIPTKN